MCETRTPDFFPSSSQKSTPAFVSVQSFHFLCVNVWGHVRVVQREGGKKGHEGRGGGKKGRHRCENWVTCHFLAVSITIKLSISRPPRPIWRWRPTCLARGARSTTTKSTCRAMSRKTYFFIPPFSSSWYVVCWVRCFPSQYWYRVGDFNCIGGGKRIGKLPKGEGKAIKLVGEKTENFAKTLKICYISSFLPKNCCKTCYNVNVVDFWRGRGRQLPQRKEKTRKNLKQAHSGRAIKNFFLRKVKDSLRMIALSTTHFYLYIDES